MNEQATILFEKLEEMLQSKAVVGKAITLAEDTVAYPISQMKIGYVAGGNEPNENEQEQNNNPFMFNGSGGHMTLTPQAFIMIKNQHVEIMPLTQSMLIREGETEKEPELLDRIQKMLLSMQKKKEKK